MGWGGLEQLAKRPLKNIIQMAQSDWQKNSNPVADKPATIPRGKVCLFIGKAASANTADSFSDWDLLSATSQPLGEIFDPSPFDSFFCR